MASLSSMPKVLVSQEVGCMGDSARVPGYDAARLRRGGPCIAVGHVHAQLLPCTAANNSLRSCWKPSTMPTRRWR